MRLKFIPKMKMMSDSTFKLYVYLMEMGDECKNYYYRLYLAKTANEMVNNTIPKAQIQEIEIGSPRVHINPPKLFKFGEEKHK